ncbi:acidic mammalian chitinase isoform X2 [Octopus bimaculoides]|uniref:GH18 domain-containing protein n=1 Tax=Octopus bimaculoides TaxID=37653 RepID=A0A0L8GPZ0_OCTBM|nr:acidic mammalian chitinase isoform X2 [Octopus bimaculoides]|eukprot:XP_014779369.1 PREDICTED: acidic mammalian chitinase-like isoform X2 [Octopus bimaculoides]
MLRTVIYIVALICLNSVIADTASSEKIVCYYGTGLSNYSTPLPPGLDPTLCTHLIFIGSTIIDGQIKPPKPTDPQMYYEKIPLMKKLNPELKVLLCNGGNFNGVLATSQNRSRFANSSLPILRKYGFDGLDLDFEFPAWNGLPKSQKHSFSLLLTVFSANYWVLKGMPKSKVVVGIPVYGHSYKLVFKSLHGVHAPSYGRGDNGGYVTYSQVCKYLQSNFTRVFNERCQVPYMYKDHLWISYEDEESINIKANWIKSHGYPGIMVYSMNYDDYSGVCDGGKTKNPLLKIINKFRL